MGYILGIHFQKKIHFQGGGQAGEQASPLYTPLAATGGRGSEGREKEERGR